MELLGRSAIVTGGAGGLGSATVRHLVAIDMAVTVFDRDADRAGDLAKEIGDAAVAIGGDTNNDDDVAAAIEAARSAGVLSLLVNDIQFPKRMGRPEEFALLVESIARNPYLNGENIRLDGALRFPPK